MLEFIAQTNCKFDGKVVPCDEINQSLGLPMKILFGILFCIIVVGLGFSVLMFLHALKSDNPDRKLWLIIIAVSFGIGGVVYYFLIKKAEKEDTEPVKIEVKPQDGTEASGVATSPLDISQGMEVTSVLDTKETPKDK